MYKNLVNALSIDVEEWYQGLTGVRVKDWPRYQSRILEQVRKVLNILREGDIKATFFILGYIADHVPGVVEGILDQGHEIGSHGYHHTPVYRQSPEEFEAELVRSIEAIRRQDGVKVQGFRSPMFSIRKDTFWAFDILKKHGIYYDSSIFPIRSPLYGIPSAPRFPYLIPTEYGKILEIPLSTIRISGVNLPLAGGIYMRILPYRALSQALKRLNKSGRSFNMYIHPFELDRELPPKRDVPWMIRRLQHYNIKNNETKFRFLLNDFRFAPIRDVFALQLNEIDPSPK